MEPEIKTGEFIIVKKCEEYAIGDIVTYEEDEFLVTHRIIDKFDNSFLSKGDANNQEDEIKDNSKIIGKVVFHSLPIGIFVSKYLKYLIVGIILFIIIRTLYFNNDKEIEKQNTDNSNKVSYNKKIISRK